MTKIKKQTSRQVVAEHVESLRGMTHSDLFRFSRDHGFDSRAGFSAFKKALFAEGIDYNSLRSESRASKAAEQESQCTHEVTLYSDAKASHDRFAVCDRDGSAV